MSERAARLWTSPRRTPCTYSDASLVISPKSPRSIAAFDTSSPPTPTADAPAFTKSPIVCRFTPPVGQSGICGNGPFSAFRYDAPPTLLAGKILMMSPPADHAVKTSVGVIAPGSTATPRSLATAITSGTTHGVTRNSAPASSDPSASARLVTVPAPSSTLGPNRSAHRRIAPIASGTVIVISSVRIRPRPAPRRCAGPCRRNRPGSPGRCRRQ